jgi:hypothetical protein
MAPDHLEIKTFRRRGGKTSCILSLIIDGAKWSAPRLGSFIPTDRTISTYWVTSDGLKALLVAVIFLAHITV